MPFRSIDHRTWFGWKTLNKASTPEAHTFIYASEPDAFRQPGLPTISELRALKVMFQRLRTLVADRQGRDFASITKIRFFPEITRTVTHNGSTSTDPTCIKAYRRQRPSPETPAPS